MAIALEVYIVDGGDGTIKVQHVFYGSTEREARTYYREHLTSCEYFRAAQKEGRVFEEVEQIDEDDLPTPEDFEEDDEYEEEEDAS